MNDLLLRLYFQEIKNKVSKYFILGLVIFELKQENVISYLVSENLGYMRVIEKHDYIQIKFQLSYV